MTARRIKVRGADQRVVLTLGAAAGVGLALRGLSPTGSTTIDWFLLVVSATGVVWAAASAPWWSLSALTALAAVLAPPWAPLLIGVGVFALSLAVGATMRSQPVERAAITGAAMLVLSMARELGWWGVNSLVAIVAVLSVTVLGLMRRPRSDRRVATYVLAAVTVVLAVAALGLVAAAASARPDLAEGNRLARQGLRDLKAGEFDLAQQSFARSAAAFERADADLAAPWAQPARLLPVANQHRRAGVELASAAASTTATIQQQLRLVDLDSLRIVDGRIDVDAVRALQQPMSELQAAMLDLERAVVEADNGWLVNRIQDELAELRAEIDEQQELGDKANAALEAAPTILGADRERVYFVMFTTPAEARGQGGFMGNYAELSVDDGHIEMTAFGRTGELNSGGDRPRIVTGPDDWLRRYGAYGFQTGADGAVGEVPWSNITISPHFPSTAQVVAELYPQSGGRPIDGVISLDVEALAGLLSIVGPVPIPGSDVVLGPDNAARYLLADQYELETPDRVDVLESVAAEVFGRLIRGEADDPLALGRALAGPAREGRLLAWSADPAVQSVIATSQIDGRVFRRAGDSDALDVALRFVNAGANKIDVYLDRQVCVHRNADAVVVEATITNTAPAAGLPEVVIGNEVDLSAGSNRTIVSFFSSAPIQASFLGGEPVEAQSLREAGAFSTSFPLLLGAGESAIARFQIHAPEEVSFRAWPQPLVLLERWGVDPDGSCPALEPVSVAFEAQLTSSS